MTSLSSGRRPLVESVLPRVGVTNQASVTTALVVLDGLMIALASLLAAQLREILPFRQGFELSGLHTLVTVEIPVAWLIGLLISGAYNHKWLGFGMAESNRLLIGSLGTCAAVGVGAYLMAFDLSRGYFVFLFAVGIPLLMVERWAMRRLTNTLRARGFLLTDIVLAGRPSHVVELITVLRRERWLGYRVAGLLLPEGSQNPTFGEIPVLGTPQDAVQVIEQTHARAVIFGDGSFDCAANFNLVARQLEDLEAQTIVVPALADVCAARLQTRPVAGIPLVFVDRPQAARAGSFAKRLFDVVGSLLALVVFAPLLLVVSVLIVLDDRGPVLFRQKRVGFNGRLFTCYKLRSMCVNAEARLAELAAQNEGSGVLFKMARDPRVTRVGRFIRRYSIDELPQLFNVLKGEMSLIGPRPALPSEVDNYEEYVHRRLAVRPGMTGLWQVSGRSRLSWDETVRLDLYYVDNWSMVQDLRIVLRTIGAVLRPAGAY